MDISSKTYRVTEKNYRTLKEIFPQILFKILSKVFLTFTNVLSFHVKFVEILSETCHVFEKKL